MVQVNMQNIETVKTENKAAIANWEDEGGALKPAFILEYKTKSKANLYWLGGLIALPVLYWLAKRQLKVPNEITN